MFTKPASGGWANSSSPTATLTASDKRTFDRFGFSVAVDGDTVVVGATEDDDNGLDSGSAYVFAKPASGGWVTATETAKLTAFDGAADDEFGFSVAVDGDTVVVGARADDDSGSQSGSAYVFTKPVSGGWATATETAKLTASDAAAYGLIGTSVALDGDTMVLGAPGDDDNGQYSGAAYVFVKPASGWADATETAKLTTWLNASGAAAGGKFGTSVALDGDTMVLGAPGDDENGLESGAAYVFAKPANGVWAAATETAKLTAFDGAAGDRFGNSVAVDGDTVVVGAWSDDGTGSNSGSAYLFVKPANGWVTATETAKLTASDAAAYDQFGKSVALDGDTLVVGSWSDDAYAGSAYLFIRPAGGWATANETAKLTASDGAAGDWFGTSVAVDGDKVAVGASGNDDSGSQSGSAYVFAKPAGGWVSATQTAKLTASDGAAEDEYGHSVAVDGDTVLVGAHKNDDDGSASGSAYAYQVSAWTAIADSAAGGANASSYVVTGLSSGTAYTFRIRATNAVGTSAPSAAVTVTTTNTAPTAVDDSATTSAATAVTIDVVANDTDPGGDTLSVTSVTTPGNGTVTLGSDGTVTYTPDALFSGSDSFDYTVSDGTDTDTGTVTITVTGS